METVTCPYCENNTKINPIDREHYDGEEEYECEHCGKCFEVLAETYTRYSACDKADCLNGGNHKWKQVVGYPEIHFKGRYRCEDCSTEYCSTEYTLQEEVVTEDELSKN